MIIYAITDQDFAFVDDEGGVALVKADTGLGGSDEAIITYDWAMLPMDTDRDVHIAELEALAEDDPSIEGDIEVSFVGTSDASREDYEDDALNILYEVDAIY